jgi:hypothetical protein
MRSGVSKRRGEKVSDRSDEQRRSSCFGAASSRMPEAPPRVYSEAYAGHGLRCAATIVSFWRLNRVAVLLVPYISCAGFASHSHGPLARRPECVVAPAGERCRPAMCCV